MCRAASGPVITAIEADTGIICGNAARLRDAGASHIQNGTGICINRRCAVKADIVDRSGI